MDPARPLRDVFTDLTGDPGAPTGHDPAAVLAANGHPDLPDTLVAEAIGSYADTAPYEVAEHLAPYVMANSAVPAADPAAPEADPASWLELLASAPERLDPEATDFESTLDGATLAGFVGDHHHTSPTTGPVDAGFGHGGDSRTGETAHDTTEDPTFADFAAPHGDDTLPDSDILDWAAPSAPGSLADAGGSDDGDIDDEGDVAGG